MKTNTVYIYIVILFFFTTYVHGQKETAVWYFGVGYGLDFNYSHPRLLKDGDKKMSH